MANINYPFSGIYIQMSDTPQNFNPEIFARDLYTGLTAENFITLYRCMERFMNGSAPDMNMGGEIYHG